jgi:4-methyl-5(b-hydroxyethyl)-thiazole monophosphate biosynthesis
MPKHALIILAEGNEEVEALTQVDLLRRAGIKVTIAGLSGTKVKGAHDITVLADISLNDFSAEFDAVILPGGMPGTDYLCESESVKKILYEANEKDLVCAAICAASKVLDKAGLLIGKEFTCYPSVAEKISSGEYREKSVVQDGNIITSRGIGTAIPFALRIIEALLSREEAQKVASAILYEGDW